MRGVFAICTAKELLNLVKPVREVAAAERSRDYALSGAPVRPASDYFQGGCPESSQIEDMACNDCTGKSCERSQRVESARTGTCGRLTARLA
jgi:hypothetical protein